MTTPHMNPASDSTLEPLCTFHPNELEPIQEADDEDDVPLQATPHNFRRRLLKGSYQKRGPSSKEKRLIWYCCQCQMGPNEVNYVLECLEFYHPRCGDCNVAATKA
jgi:hypothetical protein